MPNVTIMLHVPLVLPVNVMKAMKGTEPSAQVRIARGHLRGHRNEIFVSLNGFWPLRS